jgi:hypothetical protein
MRITRRTFVQASTSAAGAAWLTNTKLSAQGRGRGGSEYPVPAAIRALTPLPNPAPPITDDERRARIAKAQRLMTEQGHFALKEDAVRFLSTSAYVAQVTLPSDVANGPFIAHTLVLKDKQIVAERTEGFAVRKTGFENFVFVASKQQPLLYGIVCVVLALGTGWLAGVVFRR